MSNIEEGKGLSPEGKSPAERHVIKLGVGFKPYEHAQEFNQPSESSANFPVPETYAHYTYLRRSVSIYGMDGSIDVIGEEPLKTIRKWTILASKYRYFEDHPFGAVPHRAVFRQGQFQPNETEALLRFCFLAKRPSDYVKLLRTYGVVELGTDKFLLTFSLDHRSIKRRFEILEQDNEVLVPEKNLFNMKTIDDIEKSTPEGDIELGSPRDEEIPERITFVTLPVVLDPLRTINIVFHGFDHWGKSDYPTQPIQPNRKIIPIFA